MQTLHKIIVYKVKLFFYTLQYLITLYVSIYLTTNQQQLFFTFPGTLPFQRSYYFGNLSFNVIQHLILTHKVNHQISHLLTFVLQVMFQSFFLQQHDLLFLSRPLFFIFPCHFLHLFILLYHSLLLLSKHAQLFPTIYQIKE